jgi:2-keto-4-pentenoate hydratase
MDSSVHRELAMSLLGARETGKPIPPITGYGTDVTVEDAYQIQRELVRESMAAGEVVRGYKVGLASVIAQRQSNVTHPVFGHLFGGMFHPEHQPIDTEAFIDLRVEPGLAFVLGERMQGPGVTVADAAAAVRFVLCALEITDSRIEGRPGSAVDTIADDASCAGVVLGSRLARLHDVDLRLAGCVLHRNGEVACTGAGGVVLGSPVNAVVWAANTAGAMGMALEPGHVVLVSSLTPAIEATAGDCVSTAITGVGSATALLR